MRAIERPAWADHPDLVVFYAQHRNRPEDLYPSERRFLPWLARQAASVLDAGCAAGGFSDIWRSYQRGILYTGIDVSEALVRAARALHSDDAFLYGDVAHGIALSDRCATVVQALGWLHWEPRYEAALAELWRLTDRYVFFDVRLRDNPVPLVGKQQVAPLGPWDGQATTPYLVVSWGAFAQLLVACQPRTILGYGYWGAPAATVMGISEPICFATFVLEKPSEVARERQPCVCLDLPLGWPETLSDRVELLPGSRLNAVMTLCGPRASEGDG